AGSTGAVLLFGTGRFGLLLGQALLDLLTDRLPYPSGDLFDLVEGLVGIGQLVLQLVTDTTNKVVDEGITFGLAGHGRLLRTRCLLFRQHIPHALQLKRTRAELRPLNVVTLK